MWTGTLSNAFCESKYTKLTGYLESVLDNVAINDVFPLNAVRCDAIANFKCFRASDTRDLISMVTLTFTMRCHLIRLASSPFISSCLATFSWVRFPWATRGKYNAEFTKRGWELWSYYKPFVDQSSRNFQTM